MLRKSRVDVFADIIKIVIMFITAIIKDSKTLKRIRNIGKLCLRNYW